MSEIINNREQEYTNNVERQTALKEIIKDLHNGKKSVEEVKARFEEAVGNITVAEISQLEQTLMEEEGIPVSEVQRLCSVHTAIFLKGPSKKFTDPISRKISLDTRSIRLSWKTKKSRCSLILNFSCTMNGLKKKKTVKKNIYKLLEDLNLLLDIDKHYSRKENLLFFLI
ncbi:hypothetical protein GCM10020331_000050 [Ectobacillus funiculus]